MTIPRWLGIPRRSAGTRHRIPFGERPHPKPAVGRRPKQMSPDSEEIQHESVNREKPLRVRSGFEPAHLSLALSRRLMRHLCAVVRVSVRAMGDGRHDRSVRSPVAAQLVGDQSHGLTLLALQQLVETTFGSPAVATRLDEDIDDVAILIDGAPEIVPLSLDGDEDFVQVPGVAQPALSTREPVSVG